MGKRSALGKISRRPWKNSVGRAAAVLVTARTSGNRSALRRWEASSRENTVGTPGNMVTPCASMEAKTCPG